MPSAWLNRVSLPQFFMTSTFSMMPSPKILLLWESYTPTKMGYHVRIPGILNLLLGNWTSSLKTRSPISALPCTNAPGILLPPWPYMSWLSKELGAISWRPRTKVSSFIPLRTSNLTCLWTLILPASGIENTLSWEIVPSLELATLLHIVLPTSPVAWKTR